MLLLQVPLVHLATLALLDYQDDMGIMGIEVTQEVLGYVGHQDENILITMDRKDHLAILDGPAILDGQVIEVGNIFIYHVALFMLNVITICLHFTLACVIVSKMLFVSCTIYYVGLYYFAQCHC